MKYIESISLLALMSAVMTAATAIKPNEENVFVKRDTPSDRCFDFNRKLPCVWITAEKYQHYTIDTLAPNSMTCDKTKGGGAICEINSVDSDVRFRCTGAKHSTIAPAGATIHFTKGQVSFTDYVGDKGLWSYTVNQAQNTAMGTAEITCSKFVSR